MRCLPLPWPWVRATGGREDLGVGVLAGRLVRDLEVLALLLPRGHHFDCRSTARHERLRHRAAGNRRRRSEGGGRCEEADGEQFGKHWSCARRQLRADTHTPTSHVLEAVGMVELEAVRMVEGEGDIVISCGIDCVIAIECRFGAHIVTEPTRWAPRLIAEGTLRALTAKR